MPDTTTESRITSEDTLRRTQRIAARYARLFPEHAEDFESLANLGAVRAASSYNPDQQAPWNYWSSLKIECEIRNWLRTLPQDRFVQLTEAEWHAIEDSHVIIDDPLFCKTETIQLLSVLTSRHRPLMTLIYVEGKSAAEAAASLGYNERTGRRLHREALGILREREGL